MRGLFRLAPVASLASAALFMACAHGTPGAATASAAAPSAAATASDAPPPPSDEAPYPAPPDDALTLGPPAAHCIVDEPAPDPPYVDTAPISVSATAKGLSLDTPGASAGRVLAVISGRTKKGIDARGPGAAVRIYAHVKDQPWDALVKLVAAAAGLDVIPPKADDPSGITVVEDSRAASEEVRRERAVELATAPLETRILPAKHASEIARVIAMTLLTCRGRVTGVPGHHLVAVTDVHEVLDHVSELVGAVDASPAKPLSIQMAAPRVSLWGPRAQRCAEVAERPPPTATLRDRVSSEGEAAGDLLVRVAGVEGKDVVVGCGGDRPAYFSPNGASPKTADVARALGLLPVVDGVYASGDLAPASAEPPGLGMQTLAGFAAHDARELANVADDIVGDPAAAVPYEPASLLVVSAGAEDMTRVKQLVDAWATR